ncbi:MAG: A/G-specific adenine glycosylase [Clostridia bacterium]|nr:A/G-specific adenine glycosylase [Clostridia bacterium]
MNLFPKEQIASAIPSLLAWYDVCKRPMAWRDEVSPYRTWVSEIMLQQTRVEAVRAYFDRWMAALPTVESLAAADMEQLYKLWEGLGYYSRVRNLKKAAEIVVRDFGGFLPSDEKNLKALPGIGDYTAGAIRSIAFGLPAAAVDGNVIRVFARFLNIDTVISDDKHKKELAVVLKEISPTDKCSDFTQALMELGALVCLPGSPKCEVCPWKGQCRGFAAGRAASLPVLPVKPQKDKIPMTVCVLQNKQGVFLRKRPDKGLLAGLWEPWHTEGTLSLEQLRQQLLSDGIEVIALRPLGQRKHVFTHKIWEMTGFAVECNNDKLKNFTFVRNEQIQTDYALPKAFSPFLEENNGKTQ